MITPSPSPTIAVVDYGMGNLRSVAKALEHVGIVPNVTASPAEIAAAAAVILPGVGAFGDAMREMHARGVVEVVRDRAREALAGGRPFLGICLGMQVLVAGGEEAPGVAGLGVIEGSCPLMKGGPGLKIPHMGWNALRFDQRDNALFDGLDEGVFVYFVHSFHVVPDDRGLVAASTDHGGAVTAALGRGNLYATQFHPEKSQAVGLRMLTNFGRLAAPMAAV